MTRFQPLFDRLARDVARGDIPGIAVDICHRGETASWRGGFRDRAQGLPLGEDTLFRLASLTKTVTSVIAGQLVQEGLLELGRPVAHYFPAFSRLKVAVPETGDGGGFRLEPLERAITIQDLLRHTSGFTYGQFRDGPVEAAYRAANMSDHDQTREEIIDKAGRLPLVAQPGAMFEYGMSSDLLGWILEMEAGCELEELVASRIARPLGLSSMRFRPDAAALERLAQPQPDPVTGEIPVLGSRNFHEARWTSAGHGLYATIGDFARFARMLLEGGSLDGARILSPAILRWMTSNHLQPGTRFGPSVERLGGLSPTPQMGQGFGLGFAVRMETGRCMLPGSVGDYFWAGLSGTYFWADPQQDLAVVLCMQAPNQRDFYRSLTRQMVYAALD